MNTELIQVICDFDDYRDLYVRRGFLLGDPNALKAEDATLRGEVSNVRSLVSNFLGRVGICSSSMGPLDSCRIWTRCPCTWYTLWEIYLVLLFYIVGLNILCEL